LKPRRVLDSTAPRPLPAAAEGLIDGWRERGGLKLNLPRRNFLHLAAGAAALPAVSRFAWAQAYPSRPVRIVVGFAPGGQNDINARLIGQWLSERLRQQIIIPKPPAARGKIPPGAGGGAPPARTTPSQGG